MTGKVLGLDYYTMGRLHCAKTASRAREVIQTRVFRANTGWRASPGWVCKRSLCLSSTLE